MIIFTCMPTFSWLKIGTMLHDTNIKSCTELCRKVSKNTCTCMYSHFSMCFASIWADIHVHCISLYYRKITSLHHFFIIFVVQSMASVAQTSKIFQEKNSSLPGGSGSGKLYYNLCKEPALHPPPGYTYAYMCVYRDIHVHVGLLALFYYACLHCKINSTA